jgi:dipeptidyl aminopeptidase/acylaminoacyl peptidase
VYNASIATAPVTDWRFYDSTYTERYMQQPSQNPAGYESSSVLPDVGNIASIEYLLMHGSGDDNVHYSNSAQLAKGRFGAGFVFFAYVSVSV